jgi:diguanylate cyclase (GGDEF)-like protein
VTKIRPPISDGKNEKAKESEELEAKIKDLLADTQYETHPLRHALAELFNRYESQSTQIERLASISDGYGSMLRERNASLDERNKRHLRQLQKIVRISDHYQTMLRELNETLKVSASQDHLTGLPNRRLMMERLSAEAALNPRRIAPFSLALIDIDHFKSINDSYGHDVGDHVLIEMSQIMNDNLRSYDVCARWGGEEFLVLLPETYGNVAFDVLERIRGRIEKREEYGGFRCPLTVSIGISQFKNGEDVLTTLKRADNALYGAKHGGRNIVVLG